MSEARLGDWIQTYIGKQFWPLDPRPEDICLDDIAHALSLQCRFAGHVKDFYSVAQHSCLVSWILPEHEAAEGLLYDASEAYLVDLPWPLKKFSLLGDHYRLVERELTRVIGVRFGVDLGQSATLRWADDIVLATEARDLFLTPPPAPWAVLPPPAEFTIEPWSWREAEKAFLCRASELGIK